MYAALGVIAKVVRDESIPCLRPIHVESYLVFRPNGEFTPRPRFQSAPTA